MVKWYTLHDAIHCMVSWIALCDFHRSQDCKQKMPLLLMANMENIKTNSIYGRTDIIHASMHICQYASKYSNGSYENRNEYARIFYEAVINPGESRDFTFSYMRIFRWSCELLLLAGMIHSRSALPWQTRLANNMLVLKQQHIFIIFGYYALFRWIFVDRFQWFSGSLVLHPMQRFFW